MGPLIIHAHIKIPSATSCCGFTDLKIRNSGHSTYGEPFGTTGTNQTAFGYTGEPTDGNGLVHLRARNYNPALGVFPNLDIFEGGLGNPLSFDRYAYAQGNVINATDPTGMFMCPQYITEGVGVGIELGTRAANITFTPQQKSSVTQAATTVACGVAAAVELGVENHEIIEAGIKIIGFAATATQIVAAALGVSVAVVLSGGVVVGGFGILLVAGGVPQHIYTPDELEQMRVPNARKNPLQPTPDRPQSNVNPNSKPQIDRIPVPPNTCNDDKDGRKEPGMLYRGTHITAELQAFDDTINAAGYGYIMSEAARTAYVESNYSLPYAITQSKIAFDDQLSRFSGSLRSYVEAHSKLGSTNFAAAYGPRALISFTEDIGRARDFGGSGKGGRVFEVPFALVRGVAIRQTLATAGEDEWLIPMLVLARQKEMLP